MKKGCTLHSVLTLRDLQTLSNLFVVTLKFVPPPVSLTALKHIYQIAKHGDCVTKFEDSVARKELVIISAVIL